MKKQFDWDKFKTEKIAVHCKTEEEAKDFFKKMHGQGMKWKNGNSYIEEQYYDVYQEKMCYYADGEYSDLDYAKEKGYIVLEWSDYMQKEFTKADLKDGMVVEERRGVRGIVLRNRILYEYGWGWLGSWKEDLTCDFNDSLDIIKVYKIKMEYAFKLSNILNIENLELIWEQGETKRMTAEEMRVKLEELTGEKIEPSREEMVGACYEYCDNLQFCKGCAIGEMCHDNGSNFGSYCDEELKQCYKKVIANGK